MSSSNKQFYLSVKSFFFFIILAGLFYILEYGFLFDALNKFVIPSLLAGLATMMLVKKDLRRYIFRFSIICLATMIVLYLFNLLDFSKIVGNFGFSLLIVTVFLYIPQIIKEGHIEKF